MTSPTPQLVCCGNLTVDELVLPDGTRRPGCVGGDALYAALGARLWDVTAEMVAPIGPDLPQAFVERIDAMGLRWQGLARRERPTIRNTVTYDETGARTWTLHSSDDDFRELSPVPCDVPLEYRDAEVLLASAMDLARQRDLAAWATSLGMTVLVDPQEDYVVTQPEAARALIASADVVLPSEDEARGLVGDDDDDVDTLALKLAALGPDTVVVTRADSGSLACRPISGERVELPAVAVEPIDLTGAGDAYCGGFAAGLVSGAGLREACGMAAVSASFAVEGDGSDGLLGADPELARERLSALMTSDASFLR